LVDCAASNSLFSLFNSVCCAATGFDFVDSTVAPKASLT